jgi:hypothetical protein
MADLASMNKALASTTREAAGDLRADFLSDGLKKALSGDENGIYNHKAKWMGYAPNNLPIVEAYGKTYIVDQIHGNKGLPQSTPVVMRVSEGFITADFQ